MPHFKQSKDGMCLPACIKMVLAYWKQTISEVELAKILGTKYFGTPISNAINLKKIGYHVEINPLTTIQLKTYLRQNTPVIVQVWTPMLDYWTWETKGSHVAVAIGFDETYIYLNDPAFTKAPQQVLWDGFLAAWIESDEMAILIYPIER